MYIRGKVHNPENADLAKELCDVCDKTPSLQFPSMRSLQAPVRSNRTGELLTEGSLTHEVVNVILASRCEWYTLLTELAKDLDLSGRRSHTFATFGIGDCTPLLPFHKLQLHITKLDVLSFINHHLPPIRQLSQENDYSFPQDAVAVIGASCRLPGANSLDDLWNLVSKGISRHKEVPTDRFDMHASFRASQDWKFAGKRKFYGNFIDHADKYDHAFFRSNPKEALNLDPQQRILLELAYQAMESSGYLRTHRRESGDQVGCFIGASFVEYLDNTNAHPPTAYTSTGTIRAFLSGRISYYFGWSGPSEVLDTACSSSLVAINRACKAIQAGECAMALAGGVNIMTGINNFLDLAKAGFLSPTGQCKPFDESADGYCRSEGGGLVVLKLLSQAVADGNHILGVIPGVATNQGGLSSSITIPHSPAQEKLYRTVLHQAGMKASQVSYVEAHGTGTQAGDPLEIASIRKVFAGPDRSKFLNVGSLKGNIGHAETAAGVASLLKVLAMIKHGSIPPQASHKALNPKIPELGPDKMCIAEKADIWNEPLLAACVNSYGAAGSNCALLCCQGPQQTNEGSLGPIDITDHSVYPIIISAASKETLYKNMGTLGQHLERSVPRPSPGDLAFTLSERRKHDRYCFTTTASEVIDLTESLKLARNDASAPVEVPLKSKRAVLAFGGQSKKNVGFEKGLYQSCPRLRSYIDSCNDIVTSLGFSPILPAVFQSEPIQDVVTLQCGTFAMQFACAMCWIDGGLEVSAVVGHSFGELTALVVSGVLSLPDGLKLIAGRASLMKSHWGPEKGTMLAVFSNFETVEAIINDIHSDPQEPDVEVACYNSPASHVLVGSSSAISRVENLLKENQRFEGIRCQRLDVTHGFHSKFTIPILSGLEETSHSLTFRVPEIPVETCTAMRLDQVRSDRPHSHARDPVHFWDAIRRIEERLGPSVWLEAGMNSPIIPMIKQAVATPTDHVYLGMKVQENESSTKVLSNVVINLWQQGLPISHWNFISSKAQGYKQIWLPPYQFQSSSHWLANVDRVMEAQQKTPEPIKREEWQPENPPKLITQMDSGKFRVHPETKRFTTIVSGHAVRQRPLCPAAMYMESAAMAVQILRGGFEADSLYFRDLSFQAPLGVDLGRDIHLALEPADESRSWNFVVQSASKTDPKSRFITHAKGRVGLTTEPKSQTYERLISDSIDEVKISGSTEKLMSKRAYGLFSQVVHYADFLQGITYVYLNRTQAVAEVDIPLADLGRDETTATRACDTVALDVFIQVVGLLINSSELVTKEEVFVATGVENASMSSMCDFNSSKAWTVYTKFKAFSDDQAVGDIFVLTRAGILVMTITGVQFTKILISRLEKILDSANPEASHATPVKGKLVPNLSPASSSSEISSMGGSPPGLSIQTSITSDGVSEVASNPGADNLRDIIFEYTGLSRLDISDDANIGDLGVDSLAAVELAEELQSRFGKDIASEDLMASSYGELAKICQVSTSTKRSSTEKKVTLPTDRTSNVIAAAGVVPKAKPTKGMQDLLRLLSETSGASVASIQESASLTEIGIDSLSAVELKDDLEDTFSVTIEDDRFTLDSTVKEIINFLGFDALEASVSNVDAAPNASTGGILRHPTNQAVSLPNPIEALAQCEASFADAASKHGFLKYWTDIAPRQDELLLAYICEAFQLLGSDLSSVSLGRVIPMFQCLPKHEKVMQRLLQILEKHNIVMKQGSCFVRQSNAVPSQSSRKLHEDFVTQFIQYAGEAKLMELTGPKLADCLSGNTDAVSLMFKGPAAQQIMEAYYGKSPMLATLTDQLATFLSAVVAKTETSANAPIRILEVGAGTGGTTARLAEVLLASGSPVEYTFTDIAPSMVKAAKLKFAKYDWMQFETFNLEKEPPDSLREHFDVVIGTNCVHATTSRTASIGRLGQVLRKDGFIVLSEVTQPIDWYDIVFGLLDGWWLAKDGSTYPLQPAESWMKSFREAGFKHLSYSEGSSPESNTQRLLVASRREVRPIPVRPVLMSSTSKSDHIVETLVYKEVDGTRIPADVYLPKMACGQAMPVGTSAF
jgi:acyl transferase domain-containing protein/SAM-dependent methyltransferase